MLLLMEPEMEEVMNFYQLFMKKIWNYFIQSQMKHSLRSGTNHLMKLLAQQYF